MGVTSTFLVSYWGVATSFMGPSAQGLDAEAGVVAIMKGDRMAKMLITVPRRPKKSESWGNEGMLLV